MPALSPSAFVKPAPGASSAAESVVGIAMCGTGRPPESASRTEMIFAASMALPPP